MDNKTLSAAQIRYLRIGPRANQSQALKQQLIQAIEEENIDQQSELQSGVGSLNKIPKYGYSELSKTVNNFGILINHNFGNSSTLHQLQKFGKLAKEVDNIMQAQKDKRLEDSKKNSANEKEDKRRFAKTIYNYQGEKIFVILHSFSVQAIGENFKEILPFSDMRFLITKVSSAKLTNIIESALRFETENVELNFSKVREKISHHINTEERYQDHEYKLEKLGTQFKVSLPYLEFSHVESGFKHAVIPTNKEILEVLNVQFDNVHDLVYKYFDHEGFAKNLDPEGQRSFVRNDQQSPGRQFQQGGESRSFDGSQGEEQ